jgi:hypothetical protein
LLCSRQASLSLLIFISLVLCCVKFLDLQSFFPFWLQQKEYFSWFHNTCFISVIIYMTCTCKYHETVRVKYLFGYWSNIQWSFKHFFKNKRCVCWKHNAPYCTALKPCTCIQTLTLKDDIDLSPLKIVQLHEIHMHAKYLVAIKDDLDLSSLKMCSSMRYTCMPNIKLLSSIFKKLWPMLKFSEGRNIWHLTLKNDLDFHLLPLKIFSSKRYTCIKKKSSCYLQYLKSYGQC